jgi:uncharacterized membrane protein YfcA
VLDTDTAYVIAVVFFATFIRSTLGFGEALIAVPVLALRTPINVAAPLAVLVSVAVALIVVVKDWRRVELKSATRLVLTSLLGIPLGILLLAHGNGEIVKLILGAIIITFSLYSLAVRSMPHVLEDQWGWLIGCGFLSGVLGGAYGMNGPPLVVYGALRRWSPQQFRATLQLYFLAASLVGLLGYVILGLWTAAVTRYFLMSLPGVVVAIPLGRAINDRMNDRGFFRFVYVGLIFVGGALVFQALLSR